MGSPLPGEKSRDRSEVAGLEAVSMQMAIEVNYIIQNSVRREGRPEQKPEHQEFRDKQRQRALQRRLRQSSKV